MVHVLLLPFPSVTVKVTLFNPALLHVKDEGLTDNEVTLQLSALLLSISEARRVALPVESRMTVSAWQTAVGAMLSSVTVTGSLVDAVQLVPVHVTMI